MSLDIPDDILAAIEALPADRKEAALEWLVHASASLQLVHELQAKGLEAIL